jgi:type VI secretion system FHA domain protein
MKLIFDIIKNGKDIPHKRNFHFNMTNGTIGRSNDASWQLEDRQSYISGIHISIDYSDGIYFIKDQSTNGTYLKYPYKKLPKGVSIKINSTDIFVLGDYEIQARFMDNDYTQDDIVNEQTLISNPQASNNYSKANNQLIPDDDFLLEDNNIMTSSFIIPDEEESFSSNVMSMFNDNNVNENDLYYFEKDSEPTILNQDFAQESVSLQPLQEHINIPQFKELAQEEDIIYEVEEDEVIEEVVLSTPRSSVKTPPVQEDIIIKQKPILNDDETNHGLSILEKKLGIEITSLNQEQRDILLTEISNIVINSLEGLKNSLNTKDKIKKDLLISDLSPAYDDANPIKMGQYSLNLLDNKNDHNIKISEAVKKSFTELDIHNIALHRASKNLINIAVLKFSPKSLEHHFEKNGALSALMPKKYQMWDAYINMFKKLNEDPDFGINLIEKDFSNEYNNISYSIKLTSI